MAGIDQGALAEQCARVEHRVAAHLRAVADDCAELAQARRVQRVADAHHHVPVVEPEVGADGPGPKVGVVPEDRIAHVVVVRRGHVVHQQAVLVFAGIAQHAVLPDDHVAAHPTPPGRISVRAPM